MRSIRWTPAAAADLEEIHQYLVDHLPQFANRTMRQLYDAVRSLKTMPERGRQGREPGTRELVHTRLPFLISYRVGDHAIEVLRVLHGARKR